MFNVKFSKKISNKYGILQQVYDDFVVIRTNNVIYSKKYNAYMFLLTNNSCLWLKDYQVSETCVGKSQYDTINTFLVQLNTKNFEYIKTYDKNFENFDISKENEIKSYEYVSKIAKEQEKEELVCC